MSYQYNKHSKVVERLTLSQAHTGLLTQVWFILAAVPEPVIPRYSSFNVKNVITQIWD